MADPAQDVQAQETQQQAQETQQAQEAREVRADEEAEAAQEAAAAAPRRPGWKRLWFGPAMRLPGWGASHKRERISYDAATRSMRIDYPAHPHASAGGTNWSFRPPGVKLPAEEARVSFDVFFPSDFPFAASGSSAGKIGMGFRVGRGGSSGGDWSSSGASFRLIWLGDEDWGSAAVAYVYVEVSDPSDFRGTIDQGADVLDTAVLTNGGMNVWRNHVSTPCQLFKGRWNSCELHMRLNTPGRRDGVAEMTINGVTQRIDDFRWVLPGSSSKIEEFICNSWFGGSGSDPSWAPGRPCYTLTRNVQVWTA